MSNGDCAVCVEREQRRAFAKAACEVCKRDLTDHVDRCVSAFGPLSCWRCQARMEEARADALESELATLRASARPGEGAPEVTTKHMGAYAQLYVPGQCVLAMSDRDNPQAHDDVERAAISLRGWLSQWWPTPTAWERRAREAEKDAEEWADACSRATGEAMAAESLCNAALAAGLAECERLRDQVGRSLQSLLTAHDDDGEEIERLSRDLESVRGTLTAALAREADVPRRIEAAVEAEREACALWCSERARDIHDDTIAASYIRAAHYIRTRAATPAGGVEPARGGRCTASRDGYACARETGHDGMHNNFGGRWAEAPKSPAPTCPRCGGSGVVDKCYPGCDPKRCGYPCPVCTARAPASAAAPEASAQAAPPKPEATREAEDVVRVVVDMVGEDADEAVPHPYVDMFGVPFEVEDEGQAHVDVRKIREALSAHVAAACRRAREETIGVAEREISAVVIEVEEENERQYTLPGLAVEMCARIRRALAAKETT